MAYTKDYSEEDIQSMRQAIKVSDDHLKIAEIFSTVQGEGPNTGIPVVFIRLSLCNLSCSWCDTPYTWNWEGTNYTHDTKDYEQKKYDPREEIVKISPDEILLHVKKLAGKSIKRVILTGGEPLMQQKSKSFIQLLKLLSDSKFAIEVETNGTLVPTGEVAQYIDRYNVSPKLENSNNTITSRRRDKAYKWFTLHPNADFKFVITCTADMIEVEELRELYKIPTDKIMLMPEGRTDEETRRNAQKLVQLCINRGYRFCNRLQVWIWDGALRGV